MNDLKKKEGPDQDLRGYLKAQHKKVYAICRLFTNNYKEHQRLFYDIIAAASQNIRFRKGDTNRQTLVVRACINMSALHSIMLGMQPASDRSIQFKSPDYQRNMVGLRESMGDASDYDKMLLFLELQNTAREEALDPVKNIQKAQLKTNVRKSFFPYLKEKLIWN